MKPGILLAALLASARFAEAVVFMDGPCATALLEDAEDYRPREGSANPPGAKAVGFQGTTSKEIFPFLHRLHMSNSRLHSIPIDKGGAYIETQDLLSAQRYSQSAAQHGSQEKIVLLPTFERERIPAYLGVVTNAKFQPQALYTQATHSWADGKRVDELVVDALKFRERSAWEEVELRSTHPRNSASWRAAAQEKLGFTNGSDRNPLKVRIVIDTTKLTGNYRLEDWERVLKGSPWMNRLANSADNIESVSFLQYGKLLVFSPTGVPGKLRVRLYPPVGNSHESAPAPEESVITVE